MKEYLEKWCCLIIFRTQEKDVNESTAGTMASTSHTIQLANAISCTKHVYYHRMINENDGFDGKVNRFIVEGENKVNQRQEAFEHAFASGFRKVILIDDDMLSLETKHIEEAFYSLKLIEFCIGAKKFGGFYLLGMNYFEPAIFFNMRLDSPTAVKEFIREIGKTRKALYKLPELSTPSSTPKSLSGQTHL